MLTFPSARRWNPTQSLHQMSGTARNLGGLCTGLPVNGCDPTDGQWLAFRLYNDRARNYWLRPLCRWSVARDGRVRGTCQYGFHLKIGKNSHYILFEYRISKVHCGIKSYTKLKSIIFMLHCSIWSTLVNMCTCGKY